MRGDGGESDELHLGYRNSAEFRDGLAALHGKPFELDVDMLDGPSRPGKPKVLKKFKFGEIAVISSPDGCAASAEQGCLSAYVTAGIQVCAIVCALCSMLELTTTPSPDRVASSEAASFRTHGVWD